MAVNVRIGGLLRCCIETLLARDDRRPVEGDVQDCTVGRGCKTRTRFRDGAWEWDTSHSDGPTA